MKPARLMQDWVVLFPGGATNIISANSASPTTWNGSYVRVRASRLTWFLRSPRDLSAPPPGTTRLAVGSHWAGRAHASKAMRGEADGPESAFRRGGGTASSRRATVSAHRWTLDGSTRGGRSRRRRVWGEPLASCFRLLSTGIQAFPPPPPTLAGRRDRKSRPSTSRRRARARGRPRPRAPFPPPPFPPWESALVTATQSTGLHGVSRAVVVTAPPSTPPIGRR